MEIRGLQFTRTKSHPGHTGLAGTMGGSDPGSGAYGGSRIDKGDVSKLGPGGGEKASQKQVDFISSIVKGGAENSGSAYHQQKVGLERVFGDGTYDKIKEAGEKSLVIRKRLVTAFMRWQPQFKPEELSKEQASKFLKGSLFGHSRIRTNVSLERALSGFVQASGLSVEELLRS
ncbi:MAG: hypothetical protein H8D67_04395 [Deltaproteobacteria bacterium]|nr:hypothetical protein [Deltaproteobacteria bacterium]